MKVNFAKSFISIGISAIVIGVICLLASIKRIDRTTSRYSLLDKFISEKTNRLINLVMSVVLILFGILTMIDNSITPVTIGLFFIVIGIMNMSFPVRRVFGNDFLEERFSEKMNFIIGLIMSILIMSLGIGVLIWDFLINNGI